MSGCLALCMSGCLALWLKKKTKKQKKTLTGKCCFVFFLFRFPKPTLYLYLLEQPLSPMGH
jgi:hypothetical protein